MIQDEFDKLLLFIIDESLRMLGEPPYQVIIFHLEHSFGLKKEIIPLNLARFKQVLEAIFGPGAAYIENTIVKHLDEQLELAMEQEEKREFLEAVNSAKARVLKFQRLTDDKEGLGVLQSERLETGSLYS